MTQEEFKLLHDISDLWEGLSAEPTGRMINGKYSPMDGFRYLREADKFQRQCFLLTEKGETGKYSLYKPHIESTWGRETKYIDMELHKSPSKRSNSRLSDLLVKANKQLEVDFNSILQTIDDMKQQGEWEEYIEEGVDEI